MVTDGITDHYYGWYPDMHFESGIVLTFKVTDANPIIEKKVIDD